MYLLEICTSMLQQQVLWARGERQSRGGRDRRGAKRSSSPSRLQKGTQRGKMPAGRQRGEGTWSTGGRSPRYTTWHGMIHPIKPLEQSCRASTTSD